MAWFLNFYRCGECGASWDDEWSCCCDDDCPACGSRHYSPYASDDLSVVVEEAEDGKYAIYYSPPDADDRPRYVLLATVNKALALLFEKIATDLAGAEDMASELYEAQGWLEEVANCVLRLGKPEFELGEIYAFEAELEKKYPGNSHVRPKIRQQLQRLRDQKKIEFLGNGTYRIR